MRSVWNEPLSSRFTIEPRHVPGDISASTNSPLRQAIRLSRVASGGRTATRPFGNAPRIQDASRASQLHAAYPEGLEDGQCGHCIGLSAKGGYSLIGVVGTDSCRGTQVIFDISKSSRRSTSNSRPHAPHTPHAPQVIARPSFHVINSILTFSSHLPP